MGKFGVVSNKKWVFGLIWLSQLASLIGSGFTVFALAVWVYQGTGSVSKFALIAFFGSLPGLLLSPLAGALVDRWDRRWVMVLSDLGAGLSSLALWLLLRAGHLQLWHIYAASMFSSACDAFQWPAYQASVSLLVPKESAGRAGGMLQLAPAIAQVITPLLAGFLMSIIGLQGIITIDLATLVIAVFIMFLVIVPRPEASAAGEEGKGSLWKEAGFGWAYIRKRPGLLALLWFFAANNLVMGLVVVLITPMVLSFAGAPTLGIVSSFAGLGMLLGGIVMSVWGGSKRRIRSVVGFSIPCGLLLFLGGVRPNAALIAVAAFVYLFCVQVSSGSSRAIWQVKIEPDIQGRVFSVRRMAAVLAVPLTRLAAGPLSDYVFEPLLAEGGALAGSVGRVIGVGPGRGVGLLFIVLGLLTLVIAAVAFASPRLRKVEDELPDVAGPADREERRRPPRDSRRARRRWAVAGGVVLAVLLVVTALGIWSVRRPWPEVAGTLKAPGLIAQVRILRDSWGIPHIYADNDHDLFFAQGYVHAQDRLWQMEYSRRMASGTLSVAFGKATLTTDMYFRMIGTRRLAEESWEQMDDETHAVLEAYAEGVNAYVDTHRDRLPVEFAMLGVDYAPWTPIDTLAFGNIQSVLLAGNRKTEVVRMHLVAAVGEAAAAELFPPSDPRTPLIIPEGVDLYQAFRGVPFADFDEVDAYIGDATAGWGSNDWAVHGNRTLSGKPILANDTHLGTQLPSFWYANGLHGGRFDCVGFSFPGSPLIIIGHNRDIAWGATNLGPDTEDLYLEKLNDPENPTQYEFMGEWHDLMTREETIEVKGRDAQTVTFYYTNHGPLVNNSFTALQTVTTPLSLRWTLYDGSLLMQSIVHLNSASNWEEFREALRDWDMPGQNFAYADAAGHIGYQSTGRIPIRAPGHQGTVPVPGWTGEYEWQGYIPFEELPAVLDPPAGYVATANNKITPDSYPYYLTHDWFPGYRAERISELLEASTQHTIETIAGIQAETYSLPAESIRPYMLAIAPETAQQEQAIEFLKTWNLYMETDRVGATVYQAWYLYTLRNIVEDELGGSFDAYYLPGSYQRHGTQHVPLVIRLLADPENAWFDDINTPQVETRDDILRRGLEDALAFLSENYGKDPHNWAWGRVHVVTFPHQGFGSIPVLSNIFNSKPLPARGDAFTVDAMGYAWAKPFKITHGVAQRLIVDFGDFDQTVAVLTTGQSGHLFHEHREDMMPLWQNVEYVKLPFSEAAVEADTATTLILQP